MAEIWPRLRKKLQQLKSKRRSSRKTPNPYASIGLEKFASLLEEIRSKQQAATSLVGRTASSLSAARSISRSAQEWTASTLVRTIHDTTVVKPSPGAPTVGELQREENMGEERHQSQGSCQKVEEPVNTSKNSASSPLGVRLPTTRYRSMTSKSAFLVVLVALGTFLSSRVDKVGKALLAALTFSAVIRSWRKGKAPARFLFSSMALYLLSPLRAYLFTRIPKRLILASSRNNLDDDEVVLPRELPVELPPEALISAPLPIPGSRPASEPLTSVCLPSASVSSPRRLAKRIAFQLKNLNLLKKPKMFRSSVSILSDSDSSVPSSPKLPSHHRRMCPVSRETGDITAEPQTSGSTQPLQRKCRVTTWRQQSSEIMSCSSKGSRLGRKLSAETLEHFNQGDSIASELSKHSRVDHREANVAWPMVGLLVTLLFLVVGRVPAIMATSFFFVVVSPHSRARGRECNRSVAARKLHAQPGPLLGRQL